MTFRFRENLLLVGSIAISLIAGEIALRLFFQRPKALAIGEMAAPKAQLYGWHMFPNQLYRPFDPDLNATGPWERLNSEGWHDVEHPRKKSGAPRILVLGDSITWGVVRRDELYTRRLESLLRENGYPEAEVISMGMNGWGTDQELEALEREGIQYNPDIVIYQYCDNDNTDNMYPDSSLTDDHAIQWQKVFKYQLDQDGHLSRQSLTPQRPRPVPIMGWRALFRKSLLLSYLNDARQLAIGKYVAWSTRDTFLLPKSPPAGTREISSVEFDRMQNLFEALVGRMRAVSRKAGAEFLIFPVTSADEGGIEWSLRWKRVKMDDQGYYTLLNGQKSYTYDQKYRELLKMAERNGIPIIKPVRKYDRYVYDSHPNSAGNLAMAADLADFLTASKYLKKRR